MKLKLKNLLFFNLILASTALVITQMTPVPRALKYVVDIINAFLVLYGILDYSRNRKRFYLPKGIKILLFSLIVTILVGFVINNPTILVFFWGGRNTYRGIVFFLLCIYYLRSDDEKKIFSVLNVLYIMHVVLLLFQFFVLGYKQDYLGGIFGIQQGGNAGSNLLLCIISAFVICDYFNKKISAKRMIIILLLNFAISAISELKIFFVEIIFITLFMIITNKSIHRKLVSGLVLIASFAIGLSILYNLFPQWIGFFSVEHLTKLLTSSRNLGGYSIDRFSGFPMLYKMFYKANPAKILFGYGLGTADYSSTMNFLVGYIYSRFSHTGYIFYSYAFMFIEQGIAGLISYISFFIYCTLYGLKRKNYNSHFTVSAIIALIMVLLFFYDTTTKIDCQYLAYSVIVIPFLRSNDMLFVIEEEKKHEE